MATAPAFKTVGKEDGLEVWRIENFEPAPLPEEDYGNFHTKDCYIVLQTVGKGCSLSHRVHYWIGDGAEQQKYTAAAIHSDQLSKNIGAVTLKLEKQEEESERFVHYFEKLCYLEGGSVKSFKNCKKSDNMVEKKLYEVSYSPLVKTEVEFCQKSIKEGGVYILDAYHKIYIYINKKHCSDFDRVQAKTLANPIKKIKSQIIVLDTKSKEEKLLEFFNQLEKQLMSLEEVSTPDSLGAPPSQDKPEENIDSSLKDQSPAWINIVLYSSMFLTTTILLWSILFVNWTRIAPYMTWLTNSPYFMHLEDVLMHYIFGPSRMGSKLVDKIVIEDNNYRKCIDLNSIDNEKIIEDPVGAKPGKEIFRVDKENSHFEPKPEHELKFENLSSDKSYIVIKTKDQDSEKDKWSIHIWHGKEVLEKERQVAEDIGVSFYEKLQKKSTLFRDEQGKESDIFLEYFGVVRSEDDKRPEESEIVRLPGTDSGESKRFFSIYSLLFQPINFLIIFTTIVAIQNGDVLKHLPKCLQIETPPPSFFQTVWKISYSTIPKFLRRYFPSPEEPTREITGEVILFVAFALWMTIFFFNCLNNICSKRTTRKTICFIGRHIVVLAYVFGSVYAAFQGYIPKEHAYNGGFAFSLWLLITYTV